MSGDKSSLSTEVQHDEHSQISSTLTDNKDIKNDTLVATNDKQDKSSSPNAHDQTTTLDGNKNDNTSTPKFEAITNESAKPSADPILDPSSNSTTTRTSPSNENNSSPLDTQTTTTPETSTTQIPDSDVNKQANVVATDDPPKTSNQDSNAVDQTNPSTTDNETNQATNPQTRKDNYENPLPADESSTSQIPDSNSNKQAIDESPKSSTPMGTSSNQDSKPGDQIVSQEADGGTKQATNQSTQTDSQDDKKIPSIDRAEDNRRHLETMIGQELTIVKKHYPRLLEHKQSLEKEANKANDQYEKLKNEKCDLNDLKILRKTVTKLKLQIPARYMTYDENDKQNKTKSVEDRITKKLEKIIPRLHDEVFNKSPICETIHQRFNNLEHELRLCLLCFSVFPENTEISRRTMIYWWIAEGLIPKEDDVAEDCANDFFNQLMDKDFIEPVSRRYERHNVAFCKMNPMVRAALIMIADNLKFFDFDKYGNPKDFGKFDEIMSPEDMPDVYPLGEPREFFDFFDKYRQSISDQIDFIDFYGNRCQFAALHTQDQSQELVDRDGNGIDEKRTYYLYRKKEITTKSYKVCLMASGLSKGIPWENLHMLFNVEDNILEFKPEWFSRMKNINILFLGKWQSSVAHHIEVEEFEFEKSLDYMNHVRFFSLQGVSRITKLPVSISKLKSLLILDLRACHDLDTIPGTIGLLKCLTHLDMSECYLLSKIPKEISLLKSLQVLKGFVVVESTEKDVCTLQDLKKLENLKKLSMYTHMENFPEVSHIDALEKLVTLRKLTILWGGNIQSEESTSKDDGGNNKKHNLTSKVRRIIPRKKRVEGNFRRMNAFSNSTWGSRLEKLDLKCFPHPDSPNWLTAENFKGLKKLYIRGGNFSDLGQYDNHFQWDDSPILPKETWTVEIMRLKYLEELNMEWRELHNLFPRLNSLEKVKCPRLTLFPCNEKGIWMKK